MANTVHVYAPTTWTDGVTQGTHVNMNNLETQSGVALNGFNADLLTAFVLSGITCTKDGVTANQLDIASGRAYITMSDGTRGLIVVGADNTHTTSAFSSTYHLYLQPDGTWYWSTSNTPAANSLSICTVTTDGSGNISAVTDTRTLNPSLLSGMAGTPTTPPLSVAGKLTQNVAGGSLQNSLNTDGSISVGGGPLYFDTFALNSETANSVRIGTTNGAAGTVNMRIINATPGYIGVVSGGSAKLSSWDQNGNLTNAGALASVGGQASVGSFGAPVIVAQASDVHVTVTTQQTILSYTPATTGLYRVSLHISNGNNVSSNITVSASYTDPHLGNPKAYALVTSLAGSIPHLDGGVSVVAGVSLACAIPAIWASSAGPIQLLYTNPTGTPNDFVSVVIERLS